MNLVTTQEIVRKILESNGHIFTVDFTKRLTGELRTMNARLGVKKHLSGGKLPYDPKENGVITCFDLQKNGYRNISIEGIRRIKINNEEFRVI